MICPEIPRPVGTGGQVRSYHFFWELAQRFELTLVILTPISDQATYDSLSSHCRKIIAPAAKQISASSGRWRSALQTIQSIFQPQKNHWINFLDRYLYYYQTRLEKSGQRLTHKLMSWLLQTELAALVGKSPPPSTTHYINRSFSDIQGTIASLTASQTIDLVFFEHSFTYPLIPSRIQFSNRPFIVCNAHNIESVIYQRLAQNDKQAKRHNEIQKKLLEHWEARAFSDCDLVLTCSEKDMLTAKTVSPDGSYQVAPNGVDIDYFSPRELQQLDQPRVLFTGTMDYHANKDAADYFLSDILPLIRKKIPNCEFIIAGRRAAKAFPPEKVASHIVVISDPEDIRPVFDQAAVVVVPLRIGGGTRLKILEALSIGRAVVSTSIGAEGVPYESGEHLLIADSPNAFAESVIELLEDQAKAKKLASKGQNWARSNYSWPAIREAAVGKLAKAL